MLKPSFSTVACPEWTLSRVADAASRWGFESVELRTSGDDARTLACDPALTGTERIRSLFGQQGVEVSCLATSLAFDTPVQPPVVGLVLSDTETEVRAAKRAVRLAATIECPFVRVFGFRLEDAERRSRGVKRISERLEKVVDGARHSGVKVVLENGGSFERAEQVREVVDRVNSPLLGVSWSLSASCLAGMDPADEVRTLGDKLWVARVRDTRDGRPCSLGDGELPCREGVEALAGRGFRGPVVFEWDRLWFDGLAGPDEVMPGVAERIIGWGASAAASGAGAAAAGA